MAGAYQPVEIGRRPPMFDAMDQLAQSLGQVAGDKQQAAQLAEQKKRQDQQDYQAALAKAQAAYRQKDYAGAAAILAPFKGRLIQDHQAAMSEPLAPQAQPPGTPPGVAKIPPAPQPGGPQGGSPVPDGLEQAQGLAHSQPAMGSPPEQGAIDPGLVDSLPIGAMGQGPPPPAAAPPPPENPLFAAQAATKARDQSRAHTLLAFTPPGGQEMTIDPQAQEEAAQKDRLAQMDAAFAGSQDPVVQKYYPQIRMAAASSDQDLKPMDMLRYMHFMASTEQSGTNATTRADLTREGMTQRGELSADRITAGHENAHIAAKGRTDAAGILANSALKGSTAATAVAGRFDSEFRNWAQQQQWGKLKQADTALKQALRNVASGNPLSEQGAKVMYGRFERGAMPTEGEMHVLYTNLAGRIANFGPKFVERMVRGGLTDAEREIVQDALDNAETEVNHQVDLIYNSARKKFGPGSGHENMQGNVNANVGALMAGVGLERPPVFTAAEGETLPTVVFGEGNPIIEAHHAKKAGGAKKKGAPKDKNAEAMKWANEHAHSANKEEAAMAAEILRRNQPQQAAATP